MKSVVSQTDPPKKKTNPNKRQRAKAKRMSERGGTWDLPEQPAVPSLAEYVEIQRSANEKDQYASTLPFEIQKVTIRKAAAILQRTKLRWSWLDKAGKLDTENKTGLGTLGYFPQEIRDVIFQDVVDDHLGAIIDNAHEFMHGKCTVADGYAYLGLNGLSLRNFHYQSCVRYSNYSFPHGTRDVLDLSWYVPAFIIQPRFGLELRLASRTIQHQLDSLWLSTSTIEFSCENAWIDFFTKLASAHRRIVRRIIIRTFDNSCCCNNLPGGEQQATRVERWIQAFNKTPSTVFKYLVDVKFDLGGQVHPRPHCGWVGSWGSRHDTIANGLTVRVTDIEEVEKTLRMLAAGLRQHVPKARIGLAATKYFLEEDVMALRVAVAGAEGNGTIG